MATTTKAAKPKRDELQEYFQLEERRKALERESRDLRKLQGEIEEKVLDYVRANGGPERVAVVCGYRLAVELASGRVEWKTEYMREVGQEKAEALIQAAPKKEVVKIEAP